MRFSAFVIGLALALGRQAPSALPSPAAAFPGSLIAVGDHRIYLSCSGATGRGPTIILESGGGGTSADWSSVREQVGGELHTCAYDRAGLGRSEPGPVPRTMRQEVFELHALLKAAREKPPYVMVGQSIGGLLVRLYAGSYADEVAGAVLVDPTHESAVLGSLHYGGLVRLREKAAGRPVPKPRRSTAGSREDPSTDYMAEEFRQIFLARQTCPQPLGQRPLIVLAAGKRSAPPPGTSEELWKTLRDERDQLVHDLVGLSSNAKFIRDDASGHELHRDNPALVAQAIKEVHDSAAKKTPLQGSPQK